MKKLILLMSVAALLAGPGSADTVLFKSGDRLTGTVKSIKGGKMLFDSKVAGALVLTMEDIQTFSSEESIKIVLGDGTTVEQPAAAADGGGIEIETTDGQRRTLALDQITAVNPEKVVWSGSLLGSYMQTAGNSVTRSASIMGEAIRRSEDTRLLLDAGYFYSQQKTDAGGTETTADNLFIGGKFDYFWSKQFYTYVNARYYKDRILKLDHRLTTGAGLGYQWIETDDWNVFTELGLAYVDERYAEFDESNTYVSGRGAYHIARNFGSRFGLFHNFEILDNLDETSEYLITTDAGLRAQITALWFIEARALLLYNSTPPADTKKADTRYTVGLGLKF